MDCALYFTYTFAERGSSYQAAGATLLLDQSLVKMAEEGDVGEGPSSQVTVVLCSPMKTPLKIGGHSCMHFNLYNEDTSLRNTFHWCPRCARFHRCGIWTSMLKGIYKQRPNCGKTNMKYSYVNVPHYQWGIYSTVGMGTIVSMGTV